MNKKNKMLLVVLSFVVVCAIGYALFSENITVTGTATASGNFSLKLSCMNATDNSNFIEANRAYKNVDISNPSISCSNNTITSSVTLNRPGSIHTFLIEVENTGTIPFRLKSVENVKNGSIATIENVELSDYDLFISDEVNYIYTSFLFDSIWEDPETIENGYVEPNYIGDSYPFNTYNFTNVIIPGGKAVFYIETWWQEIATESLPNGVDLNSEYKLNFEQITN